MNDYWVGRYHEENGELIWEGQWYDNAHSERFYYEWYEEGHYETIVWYTYKWNAPTSYRTYDLAKFEHIIDNTPTLNFTLDSSDITGDVGFGDDVTVISIVTGSQTATLIPLGGNLFNIELTRTFNIAGASFTQTLTDFTYRPDQDDYLPANVDSFYQGLTAQGIQYEATISEGHISAGIPGAPSLLSLPLPSGTSPSGVFTPEEETDIPEVSPELVEAIIDNIESKLTEMLSNLGNLGQEIIGGVVNWLRGLGDYIINCATRALYGLFNLLGIDSSEQEIATSTILFDILFNNIPLEGDLLYTSAQALVEAAAENGLILYPQITTMSELAKIDWPFIAHVGGDHFVLVTEIKDGYVFLVESNEQEYQVPLDEFLTQWQGFIISPVKIEAAVQLDATESMPASTALPFDMNLPFNLPRINTQQNTNLNGLEIMPMNLIDTQPNCPVNVLGARPVNPLFETSVNPRAPPSLEQDSLLSQDSDLLEKLIGVENPTLADILAFFGLEDIDPANWTSHTTGYKIYEYDENGFLTRVYAENIRVTQDIFGNYYTTHTEETYQIISNKPLLDTVEKTTQGIDIFGSSYTSVEKLKYSYGEYTNPDTGRASPLALIDVEHLEVSLGDATVEAGLTLSIDIFGNTVITTVESEYEIFFGEPRVVKAITTEIATGIFGSIRTQTTTVTYEYGDINVGEQAAGITDRGALRKGWGIVSASGTITGYTEDFSGNVINISGSQDYIAVHGQALLESSTTTEIGEDILGNSYTTFSTTLNEYSLIEANGKKAYLLINQTINSVTNGNDIFGGFYTSTVLTEYQYGTFVAQTNDGRNGKTFWGITGASQTSTTIGSDDLFGNNYITTSEVTGWDFLNGRAFAKRIEATTIGEDLFGNEYTTNTITVNQYGWIEENGKRAYVIIEQNVNSTSYGSSLFGNEYTTISHTTVEYGKIQLNNKTYWNIIGSVTDGTTVGTDLFGNDYTTTFHTVNTYGEINYPN